MLSTLLGGVETLKGGDSWEDFRVLEQTMRFASPFSLTPSTVNQHSPKAAEQTWSETSEVETKAFLALGNGSGDTALAVTGSRPAFRSLAPIKYRGGCGDPPAIPVLQRQK